MHLPHRSVLTVPLLAGLIACATSQTASAPDIPAALRPPSGQTMYLEALATGVQIYECSQKQDLSFEWAFKAPEASLSDKSGHSLGKHFAGPTWESNDGSSVVGEVKAKEPSPRASAIPWLLLSAKKNSGSGVFAPAKSIVRAYTVGGLAPSEACSAANLKQVARVPYTATYYFYK
jgi:hypothetical protein